MLKVWNVNKKVYIVKSLMVWLEDVFWMALFYLVSGIYAYVFFAEERQAIGSTEDTEINTEEDLLLWIFLLDMDNFRIVYNKV